ncbi:hypothetical protein I6F28_26010 [Bradyrhizobium sp. NBAIM14]|nr:hypothetical protein [Bradyrhizobium sp. NBAIM14]
MVDGIECPEGNVGRIAREKEDLDLGFLIRLVQPQEPLHDFVSRSFSDEGSLLLELQLRVGLAPLALDDGVLLFEIEEVAGRNAYAQRLGPEGLADVGHEDRLPDLIFLCAPGGDSQLPVPTGLLQLQSLVARRGHPGVDLFGRRQDRGSSPSGDGENFGVGLGRQETTEIV